MSPPEQVWPGSVPFSSFCVMKCSSLLSWTQQDRFSEGGIGLKYVRDLHSDLSSAMTHHSLKLVSIYVFSKTSWPSFIAPLMTDGSLWFGLCRSTSELPLPRGSWHCIVSSPPPIHQSKVQVRSIERYNVRKKTTVLQTTKILMLLEECNDFFMTVVLGDIYWHSDKVAL